MDFFTEYADAYRYKCLEIIGKGSYGVVCAAIDTHTGEKVAIKKITDIFNNISDAMRILREIKLLRLLRHPDIIEIKHIMMPPSRRDFKNIYVVFELMESDLHQVIKTNDDWSRLTHDHHRSFLYQMLRALKYMHAANIYHRDLKPGNILANANCKLKICDFGLARVSFSDAPTAVMWTDYIATRWYRAPELCGSFSSKYTTAIDIWSIGCIFAEVLTGKPLFPGKGVTHQLDLITDFLGTPSTDTISGVRSEKARKYLTDMQKKRPVPFSQKFPNLDPLAIRLLQRLLAFDPKDRPTAEKALADPYFKGLAKVEREPSCKPISKLEFEFENRRTTIEDLRELIYREILEYHPRLLQDYLVGNDSSSFLHPRSIGSRKRKSRESPERREGMAAAAFLPSKNWQPKPTDRSYRTSNTNPQIHLNTTLSTRIRTLNPLPFLTTRNASNPQSHPSILPPLVVVGSANADIYVEIDRLPKEGETIFAKAGLTLAGGKGANQAVCGGKLSYPTYFVGQVGEDANGKLIAEALQGGGVQLDHLRTVSTAPTGHAVVMLQSDGQNSIIIVGGANMSCWPGTLSDEDLVVVKNAGIVLLQREIPESVNTQVAKAAKSAGVPVILDAGGVDAPVPSDLLSLIDIFSPNESELAHLTGMPTDSFEQISQAVEKCHKMGVSQVLVKLGDKGSALFTEGEETIRQPIISAPRVLDTTGAGDTFTAAFAVALVEGKSKKECLKFAAAAASLCVRVKGAIPGMLDRNSVLDVLDQAL